MLQSLTSLFGYQIQAQDEEFGQIDGAYFDDQQWIVRYLVVKTGSWFFQKKVLLSPVSFVPPEAKPNWNERTVPVFLTKEQVKQAPDISEDNPVFRQKEIEMAKYFSWPYYWENTPLMSPQTPYIPPPVIEPKKENESKQVRESHLRSSREVMKYSIQGEDGEIGHVKDFILDVESWQIMYFVVDTKRIIPGKKVLLSTRWIQDIIWEQSQVQVNLPCEIIKKAPDYDPHVPVNRETEKVLYDYYGRPKYWE